MPTRYKQPRGNSRRNHDSGKRNMELIASVSRSSGLEKDGDALRNFALQEEYRQFIQGKLNDYWDRYPYGHSPKDTKHRDEMRSNVLILFRKLREGILSTKRNDEFALEAYETSMYLSILFSTPLQTTSIISHLVPSMYKTRPHLPKSCNIASTLSLVHFLVAAYPSQSRYSDHLRSLPVNFLSACTRAWLRELVRSLRQHNFTRIERVTNRAALLRAMEVDPAYEVAQNNPNAPRDLGVEALASLLDVLRSKARDTTWTIIRGAYYELSCPLPNAAAPSLTRDWLLRSLLLSTVAYTKDKNDESSVLDLWLQQRHSLGELRPKEGAEGRWIVCKTKK